MKFKLFKWESKDGISLDDFIDSLEEKGWIMVGSTIIRYDEDGPVKVIVSCYVERSIV